MKKFSKGKIIIILGVLILVFLSFRRSDFSSPYDSMDPEFVVRDLEALTPEAEDVAREFLNRCWDEGLPVKITETYRSQARQEHLYSQGRTREGDVVTWTLESSHTKGIAFDIAKEGSDPYGDEDFFRQCAEIGLDMGLDCGYFWVQRDAAHFQLKTSFWPFRN